MRAGIAHWQGRISPVFDASDRMWLIELEDGREVRREDVALTARHPFERAREVSERGVELLCCGAISRELESALAAAGVEVAGFICGDIEAVIAALREGTPVEGRFAMPGCCGRRRQRRSGRCGGGRRGGWADGRPERR